MQRWIPLMVVASLSIGASEASTQEASSLKLTVQTAEGPKEFAFAPASQETGLASVDESSSGKARLFAGIVLLPDVSLAEAIKSRYELAGIDGWPEVKMGTRTECIGGGWSRICFDVPQGYKRTSKMTLYGEVVLPDKVNERVESALRGCALGALGGAVAASIITSPAGSIPAFKAALISCLSASAGELADDLVSEIQVALNTEQVSGEWHPI